MRSSGSDLKYKWLLPVFVSFALVLCHIMYTTGFSKLPQISSSLSLSPVRISQCQQPRSDLAVAQPPTEFPQILAEYATWHVTARQCLLSPSCEDKPNVLVWHFLERSGGLGDRIRGIRFSFILAVLTRRVFFISWKINPIAPFPLTAAMLPNLVDWRLPTSVSALASSFSQTVYNYSLKMSENNLVVFQVASGKPPVLHATIPLEVSNNAVHLFEKRPFVIVSNTFSRTLFPLCARLLVRAGDMSPIDPNEADRLLTTMLFRPSQSVSQLVKERTRFPKNIPFIGVHVRLGTDVYEGKSKRFSKLKVNETITAEHLFECALRVDTADTKQVFLASDSQRFKTLFEKMGRERGIHVQTVHRTAMHVGSTRGSMKENGMNERCEAFLDAFADVFALAGAHAMVTTGSSFSYTAYCLGNMHQVVQIGSVRSECVSDLPSKIHM